MNPVNITIVTPEGEDRPYISLPCVFGAVDCRPAVEAIATRKFYCNPIHTVATPLVLVVRLQHLAVRSAAFNWFKEVADLLRDEGVGGERERDSRERKVLVQSTVLSSAVQYASTFSVHISIRTAPMSTTMNRVLDGIFLHCSVQNASLAIVVPATSATSDIPVFGGSG